MRWLVVGGLALAALGVSSVAQAQAQEKSKSVKIGLGAISAGMLGCLLGVMF